MTTSTMVERVAKAIFEVQRGSWGDVSGEVLARASIEAMLDPTDEMLAEAELGYITSMLETEHNNAIAKGIYQSMLRASLTT
ncbi:MAG: hypothetical protein JWR51_4639 [Devosia sp.]|uniref:hypothetical protein n=1 Tax=Devosia sp. TaxID=1871048 RepID=UPI00262F4171|nr:hypothetical protein [Devosia sp.]MDB5531536.1 hypothetical protein [Devosia sp.]